MAVTRAVLLQLTVAVMALLFATALAASNDRGHDNDHGRHGHHHHGNNQCRPCNSCHHHDNWCFSNCKKHCGQAQTQGIDIEKCKSYGNNAGFNAAKQACDTTMLYCKGGQRSFGGPQQRTKVSLEQCGNAAFGVCQNKAWDAKASPCGGSFGGVMQCNADEWKKFYGGEVDYWCSTAVAQFDKKN